MRRLEMPSGPSFGRDGSRYFIISPVPHLSLLLLCSSNSVGFFLTLLHGTTDL